MDCLPKSKKSCFLDKSNDDDLISDVVRLCKKVRKEELNIALNIIEELDKIYSQIPPTTKPIVVYRGVESLEFLNLKGYNSTSMNQDVALRYADQDGCIMKITIPIGSTVASLYRLPIFDQIGELEILLNRGGSCTIDDDEPQMYRDIYMISITYLPDKATMSADTEFKIALIKPQ
jgi:hypothetical protein